MMQHTGSNVVSPWPVVLGCEGSGVVVAAGPGVTRFRVGDGIFGCTSVGVTECATFQEHFLMDEDTSYKRPPGMSAEEASTLGVAIAVSSFHRMTKRGTDGVRKREGN
jgi:NADPH:quinone reductase-like Zn-dependent oxidoreductase